MKALIAVTLIVGLAVGFFLLRPSASTPSLPVKAATALPKTDAMPNARSVDRMTREERDSLVAAVKQEADEARETLQKADSEIRTQMEIVQTIQDLEDRFQKKQISVEEYLENRKAITDRVLGRT